MGNVFVEEKQIVVPGEIIAEGLDFIPGNGTYRYEKKIISEKVGLAKVNKNVIKVIALSGTYYPKSDDVVIGKVVDITLRGWKLDINSPYGALLNSKDTNFGFMRDKDISKALDLGDYVSMRVFKIATNMFAECSLRGPNTKKLVGGRVILVNSSKVPRIIGKQGSMISLIKEKTNVQIIVGLNGLVWMRGDYVDEIIAVKTIRKIEEEAHLSGLTNRIEEYLDEQLKIYQDLKDKESKDDSKDNEEEGDENEL